MRDMELDAGAQGGSSRPPDSDEGEEDIEQEYEGDGQIIDPDEDEVKPDTAFSNMVNRPGLTAGRAYGTDGTVWPRTQ